MVFKPAGVNTGVVLLRTDLDEPVRIPATIDFLARRDRRTALGRGSVAVETPEHCLAALSALRIDNIIIEIDGPELPGFDGSSEEYCKVLKKAGIVPQGEKARELKIFEPVSIIDGDKTIYALPDGEDVLNITFDMDYTPHTGVGRQVYSCDFTTDRFERELAQARTFILETEAKQLRSAGIGKHLSPKDILVVNSDGPIKNSFRFNNECVRHKIVDLLGDLALVGREIKGRIFAYKGGHEMNHKLASQLSKMAARADMKSEKGSTALLDIRRIQRILPHRYPFLLVDKVIELDGDSRIKGIKNVTFNEQFFQGHFPSTPIMPGVLIIEAMAQVSGLLFAQRLEHTGKLAVLMTMDKVKIRKSVMPGDQLVLTAETTKVRRELAKCKCSAMVDGQEVAKAMLTFMLVDDEMI